MGERERAGAGPLFLCTVCQRVWTHCVWPITKTTASLFMCMQPEHYRPAVHLTLFSACEE